MGSISRNSPIYRGEVGLHEGCSGLRQGEVWSIGRQVDGQSSLLLKISILVETKMIPEFTSDPTPLQVKYSLEEPKDLHVFRMKSCSFKDALELKSAKEIPQVEGPSWFLGAV